MNAAAPTVDDGRPALADALIAAVLVAVDPVGIGGLVLRARSGPIRDAVTAHLLGSLPEGTPVRRLPSGVGDDRLLGGLDLAATLAANRPVVRAGLLAEADGGLVVAPMAERLEPAAAARVAAVLDTGEVVMERDGFAARARARLGVLALDEGIDGDERVPRVLADRLGLMVDLDAVPARLARKLPTPSPAGIASARARLAAVTAPDATIETLVGTAEAFGVASGRAPLQALAAARAHAALAGRTEIADADVAAGARLVYALRATRLPQMESDTDEAPPPPPPPPDGENSADDREDTKLDRPIEDVVLDAVKAAMPENLLASLAAAAGARARSSGKAGAASSSTLRGRPIGSRRGEPVRGARLAVVDTLRTAAPWQPIRRRHRPEATAPVLVDKDDFRIRRYKERSETTTLFVVDASGSAAVARLAEAKGAVELLLADCYVRRDQVALVAFRGEAAELVLPPTRSLTRAKRGLAGLPGGGGTPLAHAIDTAGQIAREIERRGATPVVVFLTDGKANIARDGTPDRAKAREDATRAAEAFALSGRRALFVDTSPRPQPIARDLATAMRATYLALPHADARRLGAAVADAAGAGR